MFETTINNNPKKSQQYDVTKQLVESFGYSVIDYKENGYLWAVKFEKGNRKIWQCVDRRMGGIVWQTADLIDGYYRNHKKFVDLVVALKRD